MFTLRKDTNRQENIIPVSKCLLPRKTMYVSHTAINPGNNVQKLVAWKTKQIYSYF